MMPRHLANPWIVAAALTVPLWPGLARAVDLPLPTGNTSLGGVQRFDHVEIGSATEIAPATLAVVKYDESEPNVDDRGGWLHLYAQTVIIHPNGIIDATGKGYQGTELEGAGPGAGHTPPTDTVPAPGGGGAHLGYGGTGTTVENDACALFFGAEGGTAYTFNPLDLSATNLHAQGMGSSGGAGHSQRSLGESVRGGAGGGVIIIDALYLTIRGQIIANGEGAPTYGGAGVQNAPAGGGAGGLVYLRAQSFTFEPPTAGPTLVSAAGGLGAIDEAIPRVVGGGGGGGLVRGELPLASNLATFQSLVSVAGATNTAVGSCTANHPGGTGTIELIDMTPDCPDIDNDGETAEMCGGTDCHDGDPDIYEAQVEYCNGIDDNCDGNIDEEPPEGEEDRRCSGGSGQICHNGECVDPDEVVEPPPPESPKTTLFGGLCSVPAGPRTTWGGIVGLGMLVGVGWTLRRRLAGRRRERP